MIAPPDIQDCGCRGGLHLACARSLGRYEADRVAAEIEAANEADDVIEFNAIYGTALTQHDYDTLSNHDVINRGEVAEAILRRWGWE